mmetsp:Transcript_18158/g.20776  ORF Transcript_18158/g.20776 Transcript_18158/m.20776 type:complete len:94 (+) Transcript_18158:1332-1613(+)
MLSDLRRRKEGRKNVRVFFYPFVRSALFIQLISKRVNDREEEHILEASSSRIIYISVFNFIIGMYYSYQIETKRNELQQKQITIIMIPYDRRR